MHDVIVDLDDIKPVVISSEEITPARLSRYMELTEPEEVLFSPDRNYWAKFGFPGNLFGEIDSEVMTNTLKGAPFIFMAHEMEVHGPEGILKLANVPCILMHGGRHQGKWYFSDLSQPVVDYMQELDKYFIENGLPLVNFVLACNRLEQMPEDPNFIRRWSGKLLNKIDPMREKLGDIQVGDVAHLGIVQMVADTMWIRTGESRIDPKTRRIKLVIGSDSPFWGLNEFGQKNLADKIEVLPTDSE